MVKRFLFKAQNTKNEMRKEVEKEMQMKAVDFCSLLMNEMLTDKAKSAFNDTLIAEFMSSLADVDMEMIAGDIKSADLISAGDLEKKYKEQLSEILRKKLERDIEINVSVDKTIVSGVILSFGSLKLDGSLATRIKQTALDLKERIERGMIKID